MHFMSLLWLIIMLSLKSSSSVPYQLSAYIIRDFFLVSVLADIRYVDVHAYFSQF